MNPYYLLNLFIDTNDETLKKLYNNYINKHNNNVMNYIHGDNNYCFDAGVDLFSPMNILFKEKSSHLINHYIKCNMLFIKNEESQFVGYHLYPRSSTGSKTPLRLSNSVGIIDSGYRGHIMTSFDNFTNNEYNVEMYDRLVQICPPNMTYPIIINIVFNEEILGNSVRGTGGFGSTGK